MSNVAVTCFKESAFEGNFPAAILKCWLTEPPWDGIGSGANPSLETKKITNMADEKRKSSSLKNLLETVYEVHRKDIKTYTSGHLNSSKLLKPQHQRHAKWESSDKPPVR